MQTRYFNRQGDEVDEHKALDRQGAMRDGITIRVPLQVRDSLRANSSRGLQRPGFRVANDASHRDARQQAYHQYQHELANAWRGKDAAIEPVSKVTGAGSGGFGGQWREGDVCFVGNSPGHLNSKGKCVVDQPDWPGQRSKLDAQAHHQPMAQAYADYDSSVSNAWRK